MNYAPHVSNVHMTWLMERIEARCKRPNEANIGRVKGGRDLEIKIVVADEDRESITPEFIKEITSAMQMRTGLFPVIYLDGDEPEPLL